MRPFESHNHRKVNKLSSKATCQQWTAPVVWIEFHVYQAAFNNG